MACDHKGPRHIVDNLDTGEKYQFWLCCECGEVVARYVKVSTYGCDYDANRHAWITPKGKVLPEYAEL